VEDPLEEVQASVGGTAVHHKVQAQEVSTFTAAIAVPRVAQVQVELL